MSGCFWYLSKRYPLGNQYLNASTQPGLAEKLMALDGIAAGAET